ncbi:MAG: T9SS type A sorting domain-containing protein [Saprospiraceae bacterium]
MHIIRILTIITLFNALSTLQVRGQQVLLTSGKDANGVGGSVAYSIGQVDYVNFSSDSGKISLGVQQPLVAMMVGIEDPKANPEVNVFPNPVSKSIHLKLEVASSTIAKENPSFTLYDINGKIVLRKGIKEVLTIIPMEHYGSGMYLLRVNVNNAEVRTFKIFKTN